MIVKITLEIEGQEAMILHLDEFQMRQNRDLIPVYNPDDWGRVRTFVENPANPGTTVAITGKIRDPSKT